MQNSKKRIQKWALLFCILNFAFLISSCSIPNLESPECSQARDAARQFYSFHFANDMRATAENLKMRERFLTSFYFKRLMFDAGGEPPTKTDYFTLSEDPPRTFKIGECRAIGGGKTLVQIQLYWRDDVKTVQKEIHVEAVKIGNSWLINSVSG